MLKSNRYPQYFQSADGREQIKIKAPGKQIYVRAIAKPEGQFDYCYYNGAMTESQEGNMHLVYIESSYANYTALVNEVTNFFATLKDQIMAVSKKEEPKKE